MTAETTEKVTAGYYIKVINKMRLEQYAAEMARQTGLDVGASKALDLILDRFFAPARSLEGSVNAEKNAA